MVVTCTRCDTMTSVGRDALLSGVAHCEQCGALLDVAATSDAPSMMLDEPAPPRTPVPPPPEITIEGDGDGAGYRGERRVGVTLRRTRRRRSRVPLVIRLVLLTVVATAWIVDALVWESVMLAVVLVPVTAWVSVSAFDHLARFRNVTRIHADAERIVVSDGPLPSLSPLREVPCDDLRQLYSFASGPTDVGFGPYQVRALRPGDVSVLLVEGLDTPEEALFIEQRLEASLGITDREVATELPRKRGRGVPKGWYQTRADRARGLRPALTRLAIATLLAAIPAAAIAAYHDVVTLAAIELADEPQTMIVEVTAARPDVYLFENVDIDIGDLRPNLPALDAVLTVREVGADRGTEVVCDLTRSEDTNYFAPRVDNELQQHVSWFGRLEHCPLALEPGSWEIVAHRRWRDRGLKTDRIVDMQLRVDAKR